MDTGGAGAQDGRLLSVTPDASAELATYVQSSRHGGQPLPQAARASFESRFGQDFGGVRVHTGTRAAEAAAEINALAFTTGSEIYFGAGRFSPGTATGRSSLADELTHTIQRTGGRRLEAETPTTQAERGEPERSTESLPGGDVAHTPGHNIQSLPSAGEMFDVVKDTVSKAAGIGESAIDTAGSAISGAADTSSQALNARAYAVGNNIGRCEKDVQSLQRLAVFGGNQYQPATASGRRLLAHELTDVVQQGGVRSSGYQASRVSNTDKTNVESAGEMPLSATERVRQLSTPTVQRQPAPPPKPMTRAEEIRLSFLSPGEVEVLPTPPSLSLYNDFVDFIKAYRDLPQYVDRFGEGQRAPRRDLMAKASIGAWHDDEVPPPPFASSPESYGTNTCLSEKTEELNDAVNLSTESDQADANEVTERSGLLLAGLL